MSEPLHEHIAVRAYFLHEHEQDMGLPDLGPWHYWFHAECFERIEMHMSDEPSDWTEDDYFPFEMRGVEEM